MNTFFLFLLFFFQFPLLLRAADFQYCSIKDASKHAANQKLLSTILEEELSSFDSQLTSHQKAAYLTSKISQIAEKLFKSGFLADAYKVPSVHQETYISFNHFTLWEGGKSSQEAIPVTFLVYVWPSQEYVLKFDKSNSNNCYYSSKIHSHPITCAFAVLQGTLFQKNFVRATFYPIDRIVRFINEEKFKTFEGAIDDLKSPFIHQMYSKGTGSKPTLSLHAYGLATEDEVMRIFDETDSLHSYRYILNKNGTIILSK